MKTRDLRKKLRALGCTQEHQSGSHEHWRCPDGTLLPPLVVNQREASRRVVTSILRVLREQGLTNDRGWN